MGLHLSTNQFIAFTCALFLMVITPGPGILTCISTSISAGFKMAVFIAMGIITGDLIFVFMALFGLATIAELLGNLFIIVKYLGAIYLILLGYHLWKSDTVSLSLTNRKVSSPVDSYLTGILITLGNPKAFVFYISFLPAFIDLNNLTTMDIAVTIIIVISVLTFVLVAYSLCVYRLSILTHNKKVFKNIKRCSGGVMISAGVMLVLKK